MGLFALPSSPSASMPRGAGGEVVGRVHSDRDGHGGINALGMPATSGGDGSDHSLVPRRHGPLAMGQQEERGDDAVVAEESSAPGVAGLLDAHANSQREDSPYDDTAGKPSLRLEDDARDCEGVQLNVKLVNDKNVTASDSTRRVSSNVEQRADSGCSGTDNVDGERATHSLSSNPSPTRVAGVPGGSPFQIQNGGKLSQKFC